MTTNGWGDFLSGMGDFSDYMLESSPSMAYFSARPFQIQSGTDPSRPSYTQASPAQRQYWSGQEGNVMNLYQGALGSAVRSGTTAPSFTQFLEGMPWTERYTSLSPSLRPGSSFSRFNPQTRRIYR